MSGGGEGHEDEPRRSHSRSGDGVDEGEAEEGGDEEVDERSGERNSGGYPSSSPSPPPRPARRTGRWRRAAQGRGRRVAVDVARTRVSASLEEVLRRARRQRVNAVRQARMQLARARLLMDRNRQAKAYLRKIIMDLEESLEEYQSMSTPMTGTDDSKMSLLFEDISTSYSYFIREWSSSMSTADNISFTSSECEFLEKDRRKLIAGEGCAEMEENLCPVILWKTPSMREFAEKKLRDLTGEINTPGHYQDIIVNQVNNRDKNQGEKKSKRLLQRDSDRSSSEQRNTGRSGSDRKEPSKRKRVSYVEPTPPDEDLQARRFSAQHQIQAPSPASPHLSRTNTPRNSRSQSLVQGEKAIRRASTEKQPGQGNFSEERPKSQRSQATSKTPPEWNVNPPRRRSSTSEDGAKFVPKPPQRMSMQHAAIHLTQKVPGESSSQRASLVPSSTPRSSFMTQLPNNQPRLQKSATLRSSSLIPAQLKAALNTLNTQTKMSIMGVPSRPNTYTPGLKTEKYQGEAQNNGPPTSRQNSMSQAQKNILQTLATQALSPQKVALPTGQTKKSMTRSSVSAIPFQRRLTMSPKTTPQGSPAKQISPQAQVSKHRSSVAPTSPQSAQRMSAVQAQTKPTPAAQITKSQAPQSPSTVSKTQAPKAPSLQPPAAQTLAKQTTAQEKTSEQKKTQETPTEQVTAQETPAQQIPAQETLAQQIPAQQIPEKQTPAQRMSAPQIPTQQIPAQRIPEKQTPAQRMSASQIPTQQIPAQRIPEKQTPAQRMSAPQIPTQQIPAQRIPEKQTPAQRMSASQIPTQQIPAQRIMAQQTPAQPIPVQKMTADQITGKQTPSQQIPAKQTPVQETLAQQIPAKQPPTQQIPARQIPEKQTPAQRMSAPQIPTQQIPAQRIPEKQTPAQRISASQIPNQQIPAQRIMAQQTPAQPIPVQKMTSDQITGKQTPSQQIPAKQTPAQQIPAHQTSSQQIPAHQTSSQQIPAHQTSAQQIPAKQTPIQQTPTQQTLGQETPTPKTIAPQIPAQQMPAQKMPAQKTSIQQSQGMQIPGEKTPSQQTSVQRRLTQSRPSLETSSGRIPTQNMTSQQVPAQQIQAPKMLQRPSEQTGSLKGTDIQVHTPKVLTSTPRQSSVPQSLQPEVILPPLRGEQEQHPKARTSITPKSAPPVMSLQSDKSSVQKTASPKQSNINTPEKVLHTEKSSQPQERPPQVEHIPALSQEHEFRTSQSETMPELPNKVDRESTSESKRYPPTPNDTATSADRRSYMENKQIIDGERRPSSGGTTHFSRENPPPEQVSSHPPREGKDILQKEKQREEGKGLPEVIKDSVIGKRSSTIESSPKRDTYRSSLSEKPSTLPEVRRPSGVSPNRDDRPRTPIIPRQSSVGSTASSYTRDSRSLDREAVGKRTAIPSKGTEERTTTSQTAIANVPPTTGEEQVRKGRVFSFDAGVNELRSTQQGILPTPRVSTAEKVQTFTSRPSITVIRSPLKERAGTETIEKRRSINEQQSNEIPVKTDRKPFALDKKDRILNDNIPQIAEETGEHPRPPDSKTHGISTREFPSTKIHSSTSAPPKDEKPATSQVKEQLESANLKTEFPEAKILPQPKKTMSDSEKIDARSPVAPTSATAQTKSSSQLSTQRKIESETLPVKKPSTSPLQTTIKSAEKSNIDEIKKLPQSVVSGKAEPSSKPKVSGDLPHDKTSVSHPTSVKTTPLKDRQDKESHVSQPHKVTETEQKPRKQPMPGEKELPSLDQLSPSSKGKREEHRGGREVLSVSDMDVHMSSSTPNTTERSDTIGDLPSIRKKVYRKSRRDDRYARKAIPEKSGVKARHSSKESASSQTTEAEYEVDSVQRFETTQPIEISAPQDEGTPVYLNGERGYIAMRIRIKRLELKVPPGVRAPRKVRLGWWLPGKGYYQYQGVYNLRGPTNIDQSFEIEARNLDLRKGYMKKPMRVVIMDADYGGKLGIVYINPSAPVPAAQAPAADTKGKKGGAAGAECVAPCKAYPIRQPHRHTDQERLLEKSLFEKPYVVGHILASWEVEEVGSEGQAPVQPSTDAHQEDETPMERKLFAETHRTESTPSVTSREESSEPFWARLRHEIEKSARQERRQRHLSAERGTVPEDSTRKGDAKGAASRDGRVPTGEEKDLGDDASKAPKQQEKRRGSKEPMEKTWTKRKSEISSDPSQTSMQQIMAPRDIRYPSDTTLPIVSNSTSSSVSVETTVTDKNELAELWRARIENARKSKNKSLLGDDGASLDWRPPSSFLEHSTSDVGAVQQRRQSSLDGETNVKKPQTEPQKQPEQMPRKSPSSYSHASLEESVSLRALREVLESTIPPPPETQGFSPHSTERSPSVDTPQSPSSTWQPAWQSEALPGVYRPSQEPLPESFLKFVRSTSSRRSSKPPLKDSQATASGRTMRRKLQRPSSREGERDTGSPQAKSLSSVEAMKRTISEIIGTAATSKRLQEVMPVIDMLIQMATADRSKTELKDALSPTEKRSSSAPLKPAIKSTQTVASHLSKSESLQAKNDVPDTERPPSVTKSAPKRISISSEESSFDATSGLGSEYDISLSKSLRTITSKDLNTDEKDVIISRLFLGTELDDFNLSNDPQSDQNVQEPSMTELLRAKEERKLPFEEQLRRMTKRLLGVTLGQVTEPGSEGSEEVIRIDSGTTLSTLTNTSAMTMSGSLSVQPSYKTKSSPYQAATTEKRKSISIMSSTASVSDDSVTPRKLRSKASVSSTKTPSGSMLYPMPPPPRNMESLRKHHNKSEAHSLWDITSHKRRPSLGIFPGQEKSSSLLSLQTKRGQKPLDQPTNSPPSLEREASDLQSVRKKQLMEAQRRNSLQDKTASPPKGQFPTIPFDKRPSVQPEDKDRQQGKSTEKQVTDEPKFVQRRTKSILRGVQKENRSLVSDDSGIKLPPKPSDKEESKEVVERPSAKEGKDSEEEKEVVSILHDDDASIVLLPSQGKGQPFERWLKDDIKSLSSIERFPRGSTDTESQQRLSISSNASSSTTVGHQLSSSFWGRLREKFLTRRQRSQRSTGSRVEQFSAEGEGETLSLTLLSVTFDADSSLMRRRDIHDMYLEVRWPVGNATSITTDMYQKPPMDLPLIEVDYTVELQLSMTENARARLSLAYALRHLRSTKPSIVIELKGYSDFEPADAPSEILGKARIMLEMILSDPGDLNEEYLPLLAQDGIEEVGWVSVNLTAQKVLRRVRALRHWHRFNLLSQRSASLARSNTGTASKASSQSKLNGRIK